MQDHFGFTIGIGGLSIALGSWLMWYSRRSRPRASDVQTPMRPLRGHQLRAFAFLLLGACFLALPMHFPTAMLCVQVGLVAVAALFVAAWAMDERDPLSEQPVQPVQWGWFKLGSLQQTNMMIVRDRSTLPIVLLWMAFGLGAGLLAEKLVHDPVSLGLAPDSPFGIVGMFLGGAGGFVQYMVLFYPLGRATRVWRQWWAVALVTCSPCALFITFIVTSIVMNVIPLCDADYCALREILFTFVYWILPVFVLAFILTPIAYPLTNAIYRLQEIR